MYPDFVYTILRYVSIFLALIIVLPIHEFAHAFVATKCGDFTPKLNGRYTLNPLAHFDPVGLICFVFAGFGWAKPVPVNPYNFKNYKRDSLFVASSGVIANYLLAFLIYPLWILSYRIPEFVLFTLVLRNTLGFTVSLSLCFFVFNLIPVYPLDGLRILEALCNHRNPIYKFLCDYGKYILIAFFLFGVVADYTGLYNIDILGRAIRFIVSYIEKPITAFWGLIL